MPNLSFAITGVQAATRGLTPLLQFRLHIAAAADAEPIAGLLLSAQIQLQCPLRSYTTLEQEKLEELFGRPEIWGRTLRNRLWTQAHATVGAFQGSSETLLPVPCTYDLNLAAAKYLMRWKTGRYRCCSCSAVRSFTSIPRAVSRLNGSHGTRSVRSNFRSGFGAT